MRRAPLWLLSLVLAATLMAGCGLLSKGEPSVASVTVTDKVDERTREALRSVTSFPSGPKEFFASVKVLNPRKGTRVKARWLYENRPVDEYELTFDMTGDRYVAFNLTTNPGKTFPSGAYKVLVFLDDKQVSETSFTVE